jgi:hypothetical protein
MVLKRVGFSWRECSLKYLVILLFPFCLWAQSIEHHLVIYEDTTPITDPDMTVPGKVDLGIKWIGNCEKNPSGMVFQQFHPHAKPFLVQFSSPEQAAMVVKHLRQAPARMHLLFLTSADPQAVDFFHLEKGGTLKAQHIRLTSKLNLQQLAIELLKKRPGPQ